MTPAPFLIVFEYAKCICTAIWAPDEKPDTDTSFTLTLYFGSATTAAKALVPINARRMAASCLALIRIVISSPVIVLRIVTQRRCRGGRATTKVDSDQIS